MSLNTDQLGRFRWLGIALSLFLVMETSQFLKGSTIPGPDIGVAFHEKEVAVNHERIGIKNLE